MRLILFGLLGLLGLLIERSPVQAQVGGGNLLINGDFEAGAGQSWPFQDGIPEVQIAPGWRAFYVDVRPTYARIPSYCDAADTHCGWGRPEFRGVSTAEFAYRVHGGALTQKYFSWNRQHEAGLYQQVSGITPGTRLRFQVYMQTWSCLPQSGGEWNVCPTSPDSNQPAPMHTKVGIDPTGGANPWSPSVVWSGEMESYDVWTAFEVEATAQANRVTVFTYSRADWVDTWPRIANDVYIDDASLVVVTQGAPESSPAPLPETPAVPPTPLPTPTARPDGAIVHVVVAGDTLFGIAIEHGVPLDELRRLNADTLGPNDLLQIGQEIIVSPAPTALPAPSPQATVEPQPVAPTSTSDKAIVCALAYHDRNGDLTRQTDTEELLSGVVLTLSGVAGPAVYTTDGLSEPYCFQELTPGSYVLRQTLPAGYKLSGPGEWGIVLGAGQSYALQIGYIREESGSAMLPAPTETGTAQESTTPEPPINRALGIVVKISGFIAVLLAVAVGVLFFLTHRKP